MAGGNSRVVRDKNGKFCKGRRGVASPQTLCTCKFIVTLIIVGAYHIPGGGNTGKEAIIIIFIFIILIIFTIIIIAIIVGAN